MRALERDVQDAVWQAIEGLLPDPSDHPLGCHRPGTDTIHLDCGDDHNSIRARMVERHLPDVDLQPRRNTDRRTHHRLAALCLATTVLVTMKLITWRDRSLTT